MPTLTINGLEIHVEEGRTVLEVARRVGIKIPTLCYHKALSPYGACRLCLVEVLKGGRPGLYASCQYPVQDGLVVETDNERVLRTRRIMIELLLARCPASEEIRNLAAQLGVKETRLKKKDLDCTLCGLCVRMCEERMGVGAINFAHRGHRREIKPPFDAQSDVCQTCGACFFICPNKAIKLEKVSKNIQRPILSEFDEGLRERPCIYVPFPQGVPNVPVIDKEHCIYYLKGKCKVCAEFCEANAIEFDQADERISLEVGAVVLAPGFDLFNPDVKKEFGYERYPNVITSLEFERILSASGPFAGKIKRLSDGATPKKIAFIQCVGSRDIENNYCSSVCCMYATKEAVIAMEHEQGLECHIFYIDLRAFGKEFDDYCERARHHGVKYTRCRPSCIKEVPGTKNLKVQYQKEDGKLVTEEFDMVVLSSGLRPPRQITELAKIMSIELNPHGFVSTDRFTPVETSRKGVFVCGPFAEPKDIPETVTQASAAAAGALGILAQARGTLVKEKEYPPEKDVTGQEPRIGVFVCHCGKNIGGVVDVRALAKYAASLPNVVFAEDKLYTCSQDAISSIKQKVIEHNLNRVVVASCSPRTHEPLFQDSIREVGLNPYLFEMANIRDQCTWVHMHQNERAFEKCKDLIRMAVYRARFLAPIYKETIQTNKNVLILGGGISGMTAALNLADQGFKVHLVEKEKDLGGNLRNVHYLLDGRQTRSFLDSTINRVKTHDRITLYTASRLIAFSGFVGNFNATISTGENGTVEIPCGAVIVATGGTDYKPKEYLYGQDDRVLTQLEFEKLIHEYPDEAKKCREIVMIQCVGSRNNERSYCSRICCSEAIKNALMLKRLNPSARIYILYRDIRTYGFREEYYRQAREQGILFVRYEEKEPPEVTKGQSLEVRVKESILSMTLVFKPDRLVLSVATLPGPDSGELGKLLKVPLTKENFFLEAHMKLRPVDFASDGIFLCGLAHYPKFVDESITQALAASSRVSTILSKPHLTVGGTVAGVSTDLCAACLTCVRMCPYEVPKIKEEVAYINPALCQGCGTCAAACSAKAIQIMHSTDEQVMAMLEGLFVGQWDNGTMGQWDDGTMGQ